VNFHKPRVSTSRQDTFKLTPIKCLQSVATLALAAGLLWVILFIGLLWEIRFNYYDNMAALLAADQKSLTWEKAQQQIMQALPAVQWLKKKTQSTLPRYWSNSEQTVIHSAEIGYKTLLSVMIPLDHGQLEAARLAANLPVMNASLTALRIVNRLTGIVYDRLLIFLGSLPLVILIALTGWVDGHSQWHIRRICVARESSDRFHRYLAYRRWSLRILMLSILYWPLGWSYDGLLLVSSLSLAFTVKLTKQQLKKYG